MQRLFKEFNVPVGVCWTSGDGGTLLSPVDSPLSRQQVWSTGPTLFLPESYSPTYQYPLVCVLHDHDRSEQELWNWFPKISDQNFLGLGIRAPFPSRSGLPGQFRWRGQRPDASWGAIASSIREVTQEHSVHPDRIYLHGVGNGAVIALQQLLLSQFGPNDADFEIAGVSCSQLPGWWPRVLPLVSTDLKGRLLFLDGRHSPEEDAAMDALREAGCDVTTVTSPQSDPMRVMNHWLMNSVSTTIW